MAGANIENIRDLPARTPGPAFLGLRGCDALPPLSVGERLG